MNIFSALFPLVLLHVGMMSVSAGGSAGITAIGYQGNTREAFKDITPDGDAADLPAFVWESYNDCVGTNSFANTTNILGLSGSGPLKNFQTGTELTGITAAFSSVGAPTLQSSFGAVSAAGTDAYTQFNGKANMAGVVQYGSSSGWSVVLNISGLDPARKYTFATTGNRDDSSYDDRISRFTISDIRNFYFRTKW